MRRSVIVLTWIAVTTGASVYLGVSLRGGARRKLYLPGATTGGHHQIEDRCELCHEGGRGVTQEACLRCHEEELSRADDSHPPSKFLDPRNARLVRRLDGRRCVTCHVEHRPGVTGKMGVTQPVGFCRNCHEDIAKERPSHRGLAFETCQSVGCHNYHDNRALHEEFVAEHLDDPAQRSQPTVLLLDPASRYRDLIKPALGRTQADAPPGVTVTDQTLTAWQETAHARAGVNCTDCHGGSPIAARGTPGTKGEARAWTDHPGPEACRRCHGEEVAGFERGKHGMRLAVGLSPMTPAKARLPMRADAAHRALGCTTCHGAHRFDTRHAAVEACLGCHADRHSLAYRSSPHYQLWTLEQSGAYWRGSGVSCATCHMPRVRHDASAHPGVMVEHDQNDDLRPAEAMVRPVCLSCHGLAYSIDALADRALVESNFQGRVVPGQAAKSAEMVRTHEAESRKKKAQQQGGAEADGAEADGAQADGVQADGAQKHDGQKHDGQRHPRKHRARKSDGQKDEAPKDDAQPDDTQKHDAQKHDEQKHDGQKDDVQKQTTQQQTSTEESQ